jgi:hypothetical protein
MVHKSNLGKLAKIFGNLRPATALDGKRDSKKLKLNGALAKVEWRSASDLQEAKILARSMRTYKFGFDEKVRVRCENLQPDEFSRNLDFWEKSECS